MIGAVAAIGAGAALERLVISRIEARPDRLPPGPLTPEVAVTNFWIDVADGGVVHAQAAGEGQPVVFIHGLTATSAIWYQQYRLVAEGFRVMTLDLIGHGGSSVGSAGAGIEANAARLAELLDTEGTDDTILVGHSMGGMAVAQMLVDHPDAARRVRGVVFVGSAAAVPEGVAQIPGIRGLSQRVGQWVADNPTTAARLKRVPGNDLGQLAVRAAFGTAPSPRHVALTADCYDQCDPQVWAEANQSILDYDVSDRLGPLDIPSLVLVGSRDRLTPTSAAVTLNRVLGANSRLRVVPGRGHQLMLEQPAEVDAAVIEISQAS